MSELKITGVIKKFLKQESGTAKASGKEWIKQSYIVSNNEGYNEKEQIFCFEVFGEKSVSNLNKYNNIGDLVEVYFNISSNEWNEKYYTSLNSFKIEKVKSNTINDTPTTKEEKVLTSIDLKDLPF